MSVTNQVIAKYQEDREKIRAIRQAAEAQVEEIEGFQKKREDYLLQQDDPSIFAFFTDLYLHGRDGKATAEAKKKDLGLQMAEIEKWLLKMLDAQGAKGIKTGFGTVFPTRMESVSVEDWDMFVDAKILRPIAAALREEGFPAAEDQLLAVMRQGAQLEFLNKGVNKTACLEAMGEKDKNDSRPNPPPPGVKYTAFRTVGVRKGKE